MAKTAEDWNRRFREGEHLAEAPDAFVAGSRDFWPLTSSRRALDLACGAGRHAVFLAEEGWTVDAVDFSSAALEVTAERAGGLAVQTIEADLEAGGWRPEPEAYGLIVVSRYLHRPLFPALRQAIEPGGLIVYKTATIEQLQFEGGPRSPEHLLERNELLERFGDWRVLRYELEWDGRSAAGIIAQKP